jgi:hypothetical protein
MGITCKNASCFLVFESLCFVPDVGEVFPSVILTRWLWFCAQAAHGMGVLTRICASCEALVYGSMELLTQLLLLGSGEQQQQENNVCLCVENPVRLFQLAFEGWCFISD